MKIWTAAMLSASLLAVAAQAGAPAQRKTPYWASLSAGQAKMRNGPGRNYPVSWLYQRQGLPVEVIDIYPGWRKVRDPEGTEGWMIGPLISDQRNGMIKSTTADLHNAPDLNSPIAWRAESGVIGRLSHCGNGWCKLEVQGHGGFVEEDRLWGVDPGESFD